MSELPSGWAAAQIQDLVASDGLFADGDWIETKDQDPSGDVRLTQLADVGEGVFRDRSSRSLTSAKAADLRCTFLQADDVLVARMPDPLGRACIFPGHSRPCVTAVDVCIIRPGSTGVEPRWLMWSLNAPRCRSEILARQAGTTRKRISRKNLGLIGLPIPPVPEQRRIAAAIEEQFSRLDAAEAGLRRIRRNEEHMRKKMIQALLTDGASHVKVGEVAEVVGGKTPKGLEPLEGGSIPFYRVGDMNLSDGHTMRKTRSYLDEEAVARHRLRLWPEGTLIFPKQGGAIATNKKRILGQAAACDLNTMGVIPSDSLDPQFLRLWAETIDLTTLSDGSVVAQIRPSRVAALVLPVPPVRVQREIVSNVERSHSVLDALRSEVDAALQRSGALRRSILERAFTGKLVPQDPADEPASVLLERIAAERAAAPKPKRRPKQVSA